LMSSFAMALSFLAGRIASDSVRAGRKIAQL